MKIWIQLNLSFILTKNEQFRLWTGNHNKGHNQIQIQAEELTAPQVAQLPQGLSPLLPFLSTALIIHRNITNLNILMFLLLYI